MAKARSAGIKIKQSGSLDMLGMRASMVIGSIYFHAVDIGSGSGVSVDSAIGAESLKRFIAEFKKLATLEQVEKAFAGAFLVKEEVLEEDYAAGKSMRWTLEESKKVLKDVRRKILKGVRAEFKVGKGVKSELSELSELSDAEA